jgi:hypothetical protein
MFNGQWTEVIFKLLTLYAVKFYQLLTVNLNVIKFLKAVNG